MSATITSRVQRNITGQDQAKLHDANAASFAHTTAVNKLLGSGVIPIWKLDCPGEESAPVNVLNTSSAYVNGDVKESVIGLEDGRQLVKPELFGPRGRYRGIVKLFCQFIDSKGKAVWMHGTGWLIKDNLLVTAGHCAFDWAHNLGRVTQVKAYIGYHGKPSVGDKDVQFTHVSRVATTQSWILAKGNRQGDVSFMELEKPFTGVKPFKFADTPTTGKLLLGVVGYPADKEDAKDEHGAEMYEMFEETSWNLEESQWTMLEYAIDTYGGNSGSPVLYTDKDGELVSIGVHVYGGDPNSASVIGISGNQFHHYIEAFNSTSHTVHVAGAEGSIASALSYVIHPLDLPTGGSSSITLSNTGVPRSGATGTAPISTAAVGMSSKTAPQAKVIQANSDASKLTSSKTALGARFGNEHTAEGAMSEEGFLDFMKQAVRVAAPIVGGALNVGLPIAFGPVGGIVGGIANAALTTAGKLAGGQEGSLVDPEVDHKAVVHRAVLAEAAFQSMLEMDEGFLQEEGFLDGMKAVASKLMPVVRTVGPKVLDAVKGDVIKILIDQLSANGQPQPKGPAEGSLVARRPLLLSRLNKVGMAPRANVGEESFMHHVTAGSESGQEGIFDAIFSGVKIIAPAIGGLAQIAGSLMESNIVGEDTPSDPALHGLLTRAVMAEAALQTAINMPHDKLEEEGFFDVLKSVVSTVGPAVIKYGPVVAKTVAPVVIPMIKKAVGAESAVSIPSGEQQQTLRPKRSAMRLALENGSRNIRQSLQN